MHNTLQEEIDEEALQCLSSQDLIAMGIADRSHRQQLLSAAVQLANPFAAHLTPASQLRPSKAALPGPLHAKQAAPATQGCPTTAASQQPWQAGQAGLGAPGGRAPTPSVPMSLVTTAPNKRQKMHASQKAVQAASNRSQVPHQHASHQHATQQHATQQHVTQQHVTQQQVQQSSSRGVQVAGSSALALAGNKGTAPAPAPARLSGCKGASASGRSTAASSTHAVTSGSNAGAASAGGATGELSGSTATAVAVSRTTDMVKQAAGGPGPVLAPTSRADEEHHLALALSASLAKPGSVQPAHRKFPLLLMILQLSS